jgi:iron-sulfur cluster assembly protein
MASKNLLSLSDNAIQQVKNLLIQRGIESFGIRIGVKSGGCSGFKYFLEYADEKAPYDEVIQIEDIVILIDPKALLHIIGTYMDYSENEFHSGFTFTNPNEKAKCGCGKSFSL